MLKQHRDPTSLALSVLSLAVGCSTAPGVSTRPEPSSGSGPASSSTGGGVGGGASSSGSATTSSGSSSSSSSEVSTSTSSGAGGMGEPPAATPSGSLLLSAERLAALKLDAAANAPAFAKLKALVDSHLGGTPDVWHDSPENAALVYLLTEDPTYAKAAVAWELALMPDSNVRFDSYLEFGELMRHAALVLDWCWPALTTSERTLLADYLEQWTEELWFDNQGSGWGLDDPGNNHHHAFLQGTAYAGHALAKAGRPSSAKDLAKLDHHLTRAGGVLDYLASKVAGGDWREGTNYGERWKQRLVDTLAVVASMGGPNHLHGHPFFAQASVRGSATARRGSMRGSTSMPSRRPTRAPTRASPTRSSSSTSRRPRSGPRLSRSVTTLPAPGSSTSGRAGATARRASRSLRRANSSRAISTTTSARSWSGSAAGSRWTRRP
ncbi:MAG: hypothetical protein FJ096_11360 [Deltaproteobacteria bacterium]|nr:hypothetical protein [Deltaproteobacteria bacterium]